MAFAADRQGYPGPLHVLELGPRLGLTSGQAAKVQELRDAMFAQSRPKGAELLAAERRLAAMFGAGTADEAGVRAAVREVERLRAELRALHLTTHLKTRDLLTAEQRRVYHTERWGAK
jgi:Spy/CpxP family protein refolding chaperone